MRESEVGGSFDLLEGHRYVRMITYRKSGEGVPTTVWFALVDDRAYVFTGAQTGKAKRIRNNPRVRLTPSNFRGKPRVQRSIEAEACLMEKDEEEIADHAISEKYGWQYRLYNYVLGKIAPQHEHVFLELRPLTDKSREPRSVRRQPMRYSNITIHARNPIKRYLQRRRLRDALRVLEALEERFSGKLLDFGGGNGELSRIIAERFPFSEVFCYEPAPDLLEEARHNLRGVANVILVSSLEEVKGLRFRYVFCLEVFEHLPPRETARAIRAIKRLLANGGFAVVGVPNELFLPALLKGLFRMTQRYGEFDARPANVFRAAVGRPPERRPVKEVAPGFPYHFPHMGFDHRKLRLTISDTFEVVRQFGSPIGGELLSSEIYLILKKPQRSLQPEARDG